jgi:hypothetical protein
VKATKKHQIEQIQSHRLHVAAFGVWLDQTMEVGALLDVYERHIWWSSSYRWGTAYRLDGETLGRLNRRIAEVIWAQGGEWRTDKLVVRSDGRAFQTYFPGSEPR